MRLAPDRPPGGFRLLQLPQLERLGPHYGAGNDGTFEIVMLVQPMHCNLAEVCSGGVISNLVDMAMGLACNTRLGALHVLPTVSMTVDFIGAAKCGIELVTSARVVDHTRRLGFADAIVRQGDRVCARGNGIFRLPQASERPAGPFEMIFERGEPFEPAAESHKENVR